MQHVGKTINNHLIFGKRSATMFNHALQFFTQPIDNGIALFEVALNSRVLFFGDPSTGLERRQVVILARHYLTPFFPSGSALTPLTKDLILFNIPIEQSKLLKVLVRKDELTYILIRFT